MQPLQSVQAEQMSALHAPDIDKHKEKDIEFRKLMRMEVIGSIVIFCWFLG